MTQAFFDHPFLSGHHQPVRFEATAPDLIVDGGIPEDLVGVFYRDGPEPLYPTRGARIGMRGKCPVSQARSAWPLGSG